MKNIEVKTLIATIVWYDGLEEWLEQFISELKNCENDRCFRPKQVLTANGQERAIWEILVQLFGDWGSSVGSGWIEEKEECLEFLNSVHQEIKQ